MIKGVSVQIYIEINEITRTRTEKICYNVAIKKNIQ